MTEANRKDLEERLRRTATALAPLDSATLHELLDALERPPIVQALIQTELFVRDIDREFGLLTVAEAPASAAHGLVLDRAGTVRYPKFQFDGDEIKPVIKQLMEVAERHDVGQTSVIYWLVGHTTYIRDPDIRPIDMLEADPDEVLRIADEAWGVVW
ncbi:hypothetical protein ACX3O0_01285 [Homoserinimonas sp. A447]